MKHIITLILLTFMLGLVACGSDNEEAEMDMPMSDTLDVTHVWGRNSPMAAPNGAFYMLISNNTDEDEKLLSASADICGVTELHEMYTKENNVMGMRPVPDGYVSIPAGSSAEFKVGGMHVMCIDKIEAFEVGQEVPLTLVFENGGEMQVVAEIREEAMEMDMEHDMDMDMEHEMDGDSE